MKSLWADYRMILSNPSYVGHSFISGIIYAGLWIYLAEVPHIFNQLFVEKTHFGYYQAVQVFIFIIGAYINSQVIEQFGVQKVFKSALWICFIGSILFIVSAWSYPDSSYAICAGLSLFSLGMGGVFANASTGAMQEFPEQKGAASAALACIENLIPAITLCLMALFYDRTTYPVGIGLLVTTSLALATEKWIANHQEKRALQLALTEARVVHKG